jgi:hypothetical protein
MYFFDKAEKLKTANFGAQWRKSSQRTYKMRFLLNFLLLKSDKIPNWKCLHYDGSFWKKFLQLRKIIFLFNGEKHGPVRSQPRHNQIIYIFWHYTHCVAVLHDWLSHSHFSLVLQAKHSHSSFLVDHLRHRLTTCFMGVYVVFRKGCRHNSYLLLYRDGFKKEQIELSARPAQFFERICAVFKRDTGLMIGKDC